MDFTPTFLTKRWVPTLMTLQFLAQPLVYQLVTNHVSESTSGATACRVLFLWNVVVGGMCFSGRSRATVTNNAKVQASYKYNGIFSILAMLFWLLGIMLTTETLTH